jgi:hypothetical protein
VERPGGLVFQIKDGAFRFALPGRTGTAWIGDIDGDGKSDIVHRLAGTATRRRRDMGMESSRPGDGIPIVISTSTGTA